VSLKTAAALVIGNEILSGKVEEANVVVLARALRPLGVRLQRVVMVEDAIDAIARDVRELALTHDLVVTSGGVGPTHDDVTVEAVGRAFGAAVMSDARLEAMIRAHYGARCTEGHLRMALVPDGASLETTPDVLWPTIRLRNVWLLPGVPEIFQLKLQVLVENLGFSGDAFVTHAVYTKMDEGHLKPLLDAIVARFPEVEVGSYPKWRHERYSTKVTFDGQDQDRVGAAHDAFVALLPEGEPQDFSE
jgi:molybdenum cofactor synthesis domain-containing protein